MPRCNNHRSLKLSTINITYWAWSTVLWWICFFFFTHRQNKPIHQIDYCTVYIRFSTFQRTSFCVDISYVGKLGGALFYRLIGSRVNELVIHLLLDRPNSLESSYLGPKQVRWFQRFVVMIIPMKHRNGADNQNDSSVLLLSSFWWNARIVLQVKCCYRFVVVSWAEPAIYSTQFRYSSTKR